MKSTSVRHGLKWAVCSALLSASTFAAAGPPRETSAASLDRLASFSLPEAVSAEGTVLPGKLHPTLSGLTGRIDILVRLRGESVAGSEEGLTREQVLAGARLERRARDETNPWPVLPPEPVEPLERKT